MWILLLEIKPLSYQVPGGRVDGWINHSPAHLYHSTHLTISIISISITTIIKLLLVSWFFSPAEWEHALETLTDNPNTHQRYSI